MSEVEPFHTQSTLYRPEDLSVFHDRSECGWGQRIRHDGNAEPGTDGRRRCSHCQDLATSRQGRS